MAEVIAGAGLVTVSIAGERLMEVAHELRAKPQIRTVAPFGNALHASAASDADMQAALDAMTRKDLTVTRIAPSLEDVFIALMQASQDNFSPQQKADAKVYS